MTKLAPIVFLLGTSTAGKTSICKEIIRQGEENIALQGKVEVWGHDQETDVLFEELGFEMFKGDVRFAQMTDKITNKYEVLSGIWGGNFKDPQTGKYLPLYENFEQSLDGFLQDTAGRYDAATLTDLRNMAQEERASGAFKRRGVSEIYHNGDKVTESAIDRAMRNSRDGIATILDGVPLGFMREDVPNQDHRVIEKMDAYLKSKGFAGPTQVALVHVHPKEMVARMEQRNINAESAGGDKNDRRDGLAFYEAQYSQLFGKPNQDGTLLNPPQELHQKDIYAAAEKFGSIEIDGRAVKIRDLQDQEKRKSAAIEVGNRVLNAIGFEDGANSLAIGTKIRTDVVFDHEQQSTAEIAAQVVGFISKNIDKEVEQESAAVKQGGFVARLFPNGKRESESQVEALAARAAAAEIDGSKGAGHAGP
jgi:hypothetical protein